MKSTRARRWLRLLGVALLIALIVFVGPSNLIRIFKQANPLWLLLGFILNIPQLGLKAFRWFLMIRWQGIGFSYRQSFLAYFGALLIGFLTPGRLGEMAKAFALRHETGVGLARAFSSVILDRIFDLYLLVVLGLLGFIRYALIGPYISKPVFIFVCLFFFIPLLFLNERAARAGGRFLVSFSLFSSRRELIESKINDFAAGLAAMTPLRILLAALLTVAAYSIMFFQAWCCARALGFTLPAVDLVLIIAISNLIGFLPITISNLGTREACLTAFFTKILVPPLSASLAVSWGLAQFLVLFVGGGLIGFVCWQIAPMGMRRALDEVRR